MGLERIRERNYTEKAKEFLTKCRDLHDLEKIHYCKRCMKKFSLNLNACPNCECIHLGISYREKK